jgi:hypothetical protein
MRATIHIRGADGTTTGYQAHLESVPRRGDELVLINGVGTTEKYIVSVVRHLLYTSNEYSASQAIEVEAE